MKFENEERLIHLIKKGYLFIYPTDTVYGIGCNALIEESVKKIKQIKARDKDKPLSIIAPSKQWIFENLIANEELIDNYLPGPYTLLLKKKNPEFLKEASSTGILGVRIPAHEFTKLIEKAGVPFITTSVNLSGEKPSSKIEDIKIDILEQVDVVINDGALSGTPSTIILEDGSELKR
jgi:L-threonylcarbamoyladenylate synthase